MGQEVGREPETVLPAASGFEVVMGSWAVSAVETEVGVGQAELKFL